MTDIITDIILSKLSVMTVNDTVHKSIDYFLAILMNNNYNKEYILSMQY